MTRLINLKEVIHRTGLSKSSIYFMAKEGRFPKKVPCGRRAVRWHEADIDAFVADPSGWHLSQVVKRMRQHLESIEESQS